MTPEQEAWKAWAVRKAARDRARHHAQSPAATAAVRLEAEALLPVVVEMFGDTPLLQARRLSALEAEIVRRDSRRRAAVAA